MNSEHEEIGRDGVGCMCGADARTEPRTYINWNLMLARSNALEASERSIAASMLLLSSGCRECSMLLQLLGYFGYSELRRKKLAPMIGQLDIGLLQRRTRKAQRR